MELRLYHILSLSLALLIRAEAEIHPVIKQFPLDEHVIYEIPISVDAPTTLMFPSSLTAIEGANISSSPETPAPVLLAYTAGRTFFSVRALEPNAKAAVNIVWKNRTYVLHFATGIDPLGSVTFFEDDQASRNAGPRKRVTPELLLGLLDRAKSFSLVESQYPEAVQQIEHSVPESVSYYRDYRATIEEVFRFDLEDTLVFRVRFENSGDTEVIYQPQRLAVRVGSNVYYAAIADASGIVPPKAVTQGYLAITGTQRGGRANLSVKNHFSLIVPRVERDARLVVPQ